MAGDWQALANVECLRKADRSQEKSWTIAFFAKSNARNGLSSTSVLRCRAVFALHVHTSVDARQGANARESLQRSRRCAAGLRSQKRAAAKSIAKQTRKSANIDFSLSIEMSSRMHDVVFLFDVDNTLIDNDRIQQDLREHLEESYGRAARERYWAIFDELWAELGYADYIGALERYRAERLHDPTLLRMANWLLDYPFAERLYNGALDTVTHVRQWGLPVILSDGDAVFQSRKVERSGLWKAFDNRVLIYIHKENELADVERLYPAKHYVLIDDKLRILDAVKSQWSERVTTVFPRQGHYAHDSEILTKYRPADVAVEAIGELATLARDTLVRS
jgi:hypothetical protein